MAKENLQQKIIGECKGMFTCTYTVHNKENTSPCRLSHISTNTNINTPS